MALLLSVLEPQSVTVWLLSVLVLLLDSPRVRRSRFAVELVLEFRSGRRSLLIELGLLSLVDGLLHIRSTCRWQHLLRSRHQRRIRHSNLHLPEADLVKR